LDFSAIGGKKQRHGSALIGAGGTGCTSMINPLYERDGLDFSAYGGKKTEARQCLNHCVCD
jgi:hypothetical protein